MRVSLIQTNPQDNFEENIKQTLSLIEKSLKSKPDLIMLPETFGFMGDETERKKYKSFLGKGVFEDLKKISQKENVIIVAGSLDEYTDKNSPLPYNTCVTFNKGEIISIYRKLHLFNLLDINEKPLYCESNIFLKGDRPETYDIVIDHEKWASVNIICYDIRFPEIIRTLKKAPDIIFVPAAFTWQTGKAHWEILLRARAIENQCFIVACNQTGSFLNNQKRNYGHSMIISPWGEILAQMQEEVGCLNFEINKQTLNESRLKLPALKDRKIL